MLQRCIWLDTAREDDCTLPHWARTAIVLILSTCLVFTFAATGAYAQGNPLRYVIQIWTVIDLGQGHPPIDGTSPGLHVLFLRDKILVGRPKGVLEGEWNNLDGAELPLAGGQGRFTSSGDWIKQEHSVEMRRLSAGKYDVQYTSVTPTWVYSYRFSLEYDGNACSISNAQIDFRQLGQSRQAVVKSMSCNRTR